MFTDETNRHPSRISRFFVYGGLLFPVEHLSTLHTEIEQIRLDANYRPEDTFKFDTRSRPSHVSRDDATEAKRKVINLCKRLDCKFIVHIILHDIIRRQDPDQQVKWAADYVISKYNTYLTEIDDNGIVVVDNLPNGTEFRYLTNKFTRGLTLADGRQVNLDRIHLFASTRIGASHANSAMDIVLGSFRYAINNPRNIEAARAMLRDVSRMMWSYENDGVKYVRDRGLIIRPPLEEIRNTRYKSEYERLIEHLTRLTNQS